jgi:hypothetical protein
MSSKINIGIFTIVTLTLMVTASMFGPINNAAAQQISQLPGMETANKILSYAKSGDLVNVAKPQVGVDVVTQVGASNNAPQRTQSNVADTSNEKCLICIEPIQYNIGVTTQIASDRNDAERTQSNTAIIGDRSDSLFVLGPQQNNIAINTQQMIAGLPFR